MQEEFSHALNQPRGWLTRLGLIGLSSIEAPLLAALATEAPLLLIGPHGTAKSLLLTRIAEALGLEFRHYNASLLNFDDLVGFPVPGVDRSLEYIKTPASIWGASAVIFDEISRCRPDIQNKLFPIIHERRVQGILLDDLAAGVQALAAVQLFTRLVNIGDAKSLVTHPASTTHRQLNAAELAKAGVREETVRLSIGIEHIDDLLADLDQALLAV